MARPGWLGMVVSGGYANSEAAGSVWRLLAPGGSASLRKIVWLEFAGKIWDANVIPMLLVIENVQANEADSIELYVPDAWPNGSSPSIIRYRDFFETHINPAPASRLASPWGCYLLPLLRSEDLSIIRKMYPFVPDRKTLGDMVRQRGSRAGGASWTYGIQRGGVSVTCERRGASPVAVIGGRDIAAACFETPHYWVDLQTVSKRPYGKLSLWTDSYYPEVLIALNELGLAPTATVVRSAVDFPTAALNTVVIAEPRHDGPSAEAIAAYLNSSVVRFYWAVRLRSGVMEGSSRSHFYPRTIAALPWPGGLTANDLQSMTDLYEELSGHAQTARNNPDEWLLTHLADFPVQECVKLTDDLVELRFGAWMDPKAGELEQSGTRIWCGLSSFEVADGDLAELLLKILVRDPEEHISRTNIQRLVVPRDWRAAIREYRERLQAFSAIREKFYAKIDQIDDLVARGFDLTASERNHIKDRLSSFPLNRLTPRYPWTVVRSRPLKAYMEDRFTR
jgi:hypothetical protein